jgi:hypothetical protein
MRNYKFFHTVAVCAVLLSVLVFSLAFPCHGDICQNAGALFLGDDICDDSPCLAVNGGGLGFMPVMLSHPPTTGSTIPKIFVHSIYHPPRA